MYITGVTSVTLPGVTESLLCFCKALFPVLSGSRGASTVKPEHRIATKLCLSQLFARIYSWFSKSNWQKHHFVALIKLMIKLSLMIPPTRLNKTNKWTEKHKINLFPRVLEVSHMLLDNKSCFPVKEEPHLETVIILYFLLHTPTGVHSWLTSALEYLWVTYKETSIIR